MGVLLIAIGTLWFSLLLVLPVYIAPANGDIGCGRPWRAEPIERFLEDGCHRAIVHRRLAMSLPTGAVALGFGVVVLVRRRRQPDATGAISACGGPLDG